jgi:hypothetical protein
MSDFDVEAALDSAALAVDAEIKKADAGVLGKAWQVRSFRDAFQPRPPLLYVVDGLLAAPSLNIFYGAPGSMKSMVLADLAVCVALGVPFLHSIEGQLGKPGRTFRTVRSPVLWVDMDNGKRRTDVRFDALGRAHGATVDDAQLQYISMPSPHFNASNGEFMSYLETFIRANEHRLVVIDNLGLSIGDADENKAEMATVMRNFKYVAENTATCIVIIHHPRKGGAAEGVRLGDTMRGHSTIEASLDAAFYVDRLEGKDAISVVPVKVREYRIDPFGALFAYEHREGTYDLQTARFFSQSVDSPDEMRRTLVQDAILTVVLHSGTEGIERGELYDAVQGKMEGPLKMKSPGRNAIRGQLTVLCETGMIDEVKEGRRYIYILTESGWPEAQRRKVG